MNPEHQAAIAWLVAALLYFYQYVLRSAPSVMMPQLSQAFGLSALGRASMVGLFYYGYSPFSLVAGAALDRLGPRRVMPIAAGIIALGALLFSMGGTNVASAGRFLQGVGAAFAAVGAIYIASTNFAPSRAATLIGATQIARGWTSHCAPHQPCFRNGYPDVSQSADCDGRCHQHRTHFGR